jgi:hypothetical protein
MPNEDDATGYAAASADTDARASTGGLIQRCRDVTRRGLAKLKPTRWFARVRAPNPPESAALSDQAPYPIHWVWLGGRLAPSARENMVAWTNSFRNDVAPVLWVDDAALADLRSQRLVTTVDGKEVLSLNSNVPVSIANIDTLAGVPGWDKLAPAVAHESTSDSGLRQVASDIVRIAVLWQEGGSYWDLGDTAPSMHRFSPQKLERRLGKKAPAVVPQVLKDAAGARTENGIILTHPAKQAEAKALYKTMLDDMAARYGEPDARTKEVKTHVEKWKEGHLNTRINEAAAQRDQAFIDQLPEGHPAAPQMKAGLKAQEHFRKNLDDKVKTPKDVDQKMTAAIKERGSPDQTTAKLIEATRREDEIAYFEHLQTALGGKVDVRYLPTEISKTVNDYTFGTFVKTAGSQVPGAEKDVGIKATNLNSAGWSKVQRFFGGNTKSGSWYSWKTQPGRTLANETPAGSP